jgi:hypothetical protein
MVRSISMNSKILILSLGILSAVGCSSGDSPFTASGATSSTNIITSDRFAITSSELSPDVLNTTSTPGATDTSTLCGDITIVWAPVSATLTVTAADKNGALVSTGTVFFETQYGLLDKTSCTLTNGTCTVTWSSIANTSQLYLAPNFCDGTAPLTDSLSIVNEIVAWTYGTEGFIDLDGDGLLSDSEVFFDTSEPYVDNNADNAFTNNVDRIIEAELPVGHNAANNMYDGPDCDTSTRTDCGSSALTPIFVTVPLRLNF